MLIYRPKQKTSTTTSEEVKFPASSIDGLATVATSGSYNDLTDKPEVPGVPDIVQTTGTSTTAVMSQKAVTDELNKKANRSGDTFTGDVIISSGKSLKTDTIKSADGTKWIAEIAAAGLEIGGQGTPLRLYSSTRPIHANANKELAYTSDIPTNYVTTDTNQGISGKKWFINSGDPSMVVQSSEIDLNKPPTSPQYNYIDFTDKADKRLGIVGSTISPDGYAGIYLQARNVASMGIKANASGEVYSWAHTPADNNNSDQIATTEWVRHHNQAIRGFDGVNYYTVDNVKHYYPDDNYFLVAYTDHCTNWKHVCAEMDVVDLDTRRAVYKLKVSGLLESATSNNITTYTNKGSIGVTDSFGERLNTGTTDINNEFFLVCRTTNKGRVRYEIWYNQRYAYNRHKFYFSVDEAHARTGITEHFTWNKMRIDNGTDVGYAKAGVTAYMESGNINPTYIPTSSWGVDVFKTALSNDESYTNVTIFNNNLYSTTQVGVSTILNTVPYIDAKIQGYNGYKTAPTAQKTAEYRILSEDKGYLGGIRYDRYTNGDSNTRLSTTSTLSGASNGVMLYATKGTASTKSTDSNIWQFSPATNDNINLGGTGNRWLNGYITNLQLCKVINGGGGNSLIQQNSDTNGADIIVGSTNCALKMLGKSARPTYRQGKNGTYANLALQSDIPIPFDSNDLSTGTYRSTKLPSGHSLIYIEDRERRLSGYFYQGSGQLGFQELYFITNFYTDSTGQTTLTIYKLRINGTQVEKTYKYLFVSSSGVVEVGTEYAENGTFYYKVLK